MDSQVHGTHSPGSRTANSIICAVCFSLHNADNWSGSGNKTSVFPTVDRNLHATAISVGRIDARRPRGSEIGKLKPNTNTNPMEEEEDHHLTMGTC